MRLAYRNRITLALAKYGFIGRLADSVQNVGTDRAEEVAVNGRERTAGKRPLRGTVVGDDWVGVLTGQASVALKASVEFRRANLEESDHDEPVVDTEVGDAVVLNQAGPADLKANVVEDTTHGEEGDVRHDDLIAVALVEEDRARVEIC